MQDNTSDLLTTYGDPSLTKINNKTKSGSVTKTSKKPREYHAFGQVGDSHGIRIHYSDGSIGAPQWGFFIEPHLTSDEFLSLIFTHRVITIEGENLTENEIDLFRDRKVTYIRPFDPKKFDPPEQGQPIIHSIIYEHPKQNLE